MADETKEEKSPLLETENEITERPDYSPEEEKYLGRLKTVMESARDARDQTHDELDGMDYSTYYQTNERIANTFIQPKRNKEDSNFQTGVIRQKLFTLLAQIANLNLAGDISAFDKDELKIASLGNAMEDIILKTKQLDNDDEKMYLRQYELLKHGTVFVEEIWDDKQKKQKKLKKKFDGKVSGASWSTKLKKAFARPTRNIIPGLNIYLGDLTKYNINDQPRIFTVDVIPYEEAEAMFQDWERWVNVPKKLVRTDDTEKKITKDWTLLQVEDNFVEILRMQDKWNNEFALLLNGVLMTPVGLPLPWGYDEYNIAQQNLEPIHAKFAYGKSLVARLRNKTALLDEMLKLAVLKTQKSFMPPYLNVSGRVLSNRVLMPGKMTYGVQPGTLIPINEKETQGVTQAEFAMIQHIETTIDAEDSPKMPGSGHSGRPNVNEILEYQRQAKLLTGLTIFAVTMLEWKLEWLRLKNVLANWFNPDDQEVDTVRGILKDKYRQAGVDRPIEGEGMGRRIVIPTKQIPSGQAIMKSEDALTQEQGVPVRLTFIDPDQVCSAELIWQIIVRPQEKANTETQKLMFEKFMQDAGLFFPDMLDRDYLSQEFAEAWQKDPNKVFKSKDQQQIDQMKAAQGGQVGPDGKPIAPNAPPTPKPNPTGAPEMGGSIVSPKVNMPQPDKKPAQDMNKMMQQ